MTPTQARSRPILTLIPVKKTFKDPKKDGRVANVLEILNVLMPVTNLIEND
jgi:hypothetical protein